MKDQLFAAITELDRTEALRITEVLLTQEMKPRDILDTGSSAMAVIGERFEKGEYFLPELIVSGDILSAITELVKPHLEEESVSEKIGRVVFGTVEGDIHDIAKDIVVFMLELNGFEVIDLGVDVPPARFAQTVEEEKIDIVGLSGFLTLAIEPMRRTIQALRSCGVDNVRVMIGGGPINEIVCQDLEADGWGENAIEAVAMAREWAGV
jgi:methylmalonyl-CoA mutase cobalamin-binding domain/chain